LTITAKKLPPITFINPATGDIDRVWRDLLEQLVSDTTSADRFTVIDSTTTLTVGTSQIILADASAGPFTITMLPIADSLTRRYIIKKIDSTANAVTVDADGAETIDGALTMIINTQYDAMQIVPHGTEWSIV